MALTRRRSGEPISPGADDYLVEGEEAPEQPSPAAQAIHMAQLVLIIVLAVLSLSIFWLLGVLLNIL